MSGSSRSSTRTKPDTAELSSSSSLPSKVYEVKGEVVLLNDLLKAGVVEIKGGDGRLVYGFFQVVAHIVLL